METLRTALTDLVLIPPDVERDAPLAVEWLSGETGRETLRLMGNFKAALRTPDLTEEKARIRRFIELEERHEQLTWTLRYKEQPVGSIWVELKKTNYLPAPALHIMIGDVAVRGQGLGRNAVETVIGYLRSAEAYDGVYSRYLTHNTASERLLDAAGFKAHGDKYLDSDGLIWQNVYLRYDP